MKKFILITSLLLSFNLIATCLKTPIIECETEKEFVTVHKIQCAAPRGPIHQSLMIEYHLNDQYFFQDLKYQEPAITRHETTNEIETFLLEAGDLTKNYFYMEMNPSEKYFLSKVISYNGDILLEQSTPYDLQGFKCH